MYKKKIAVVGVGNILMADEGAGIRVINELEKRGYSRKVDLIDAGTSFFDIVPELTQYDKVIIVDVTKGGQKPGTIYRFELNDVESQNEISLSVHDIGVLQSFKLESIVNDIPEEIVFFGIEPYQIEISMELSPIIKGTINRLVDKVAQELKKDGI